MVTLYVYLTSKQVFQCIYTLKTVLVNYKVTCTRNVVTWHGKTHKIIIFLMVEPQREIKTFCSPSLGAHKTKLHS